MIKEYQYIDNPVIIPVKLKFQPKKVCICGERIDGDYFLMPDGTKVHDERECMVRYLLQECGAELIRS